MHFYPSFLISLFITVGSVFGTDLMHLVCFLCRLYKFLKKGVAKPKEKLKEEAGKARMSIKDGEKLKKSGFF